MKIQLGSTGWSNNANLGTFRTVLDGTVTFEIEAPAREREACITVTLPRDEAKELAFRLLGDLLG